MRMSRDDKFMQLANKWQKRARTNQKGHYMVAEKLRHKNCQFGVPVVVLSAIIGTSIFATLTKDIEVWSRVIVGLVSIAIAVLSSLQTFFRFSDRAEQHRSAGIQYGILNREMERVCTLPPEDQLKQKQLLVEIENKFNELALKVPGIPGTLWDKIPRELTPDTNC